MVTASELLDKVRALGPVTSRHVLVMPYDLVPGESQRDMVEMIHHVLGSDTPLIVFHDGDVRVLDEDNMRAAGWVRAEGTI